MDAQQIFGTQVLLSTVLYVLIAIWYVAPRLAHLPLEDALQPLVALHATRHFGLVFLVPTVVGTSVPRAFAAPAAYGDLLAGLLALLALIALHERWPIALAVTWILNIEGLIDLLYAMSTGVRLQVEIGAAYYIPTVIVPALVVSHLLMLVMLVRGRRGRPA
jgi:hypothetical protein